MNEPHLNWRMKSNDPRARWAGDRRLERAAPELSVWQTHTGAGYWPDYQMRLLKRGCARIRSTRFGDRGVGRPSGYLKNPLIHYNYESIAQFHQKQTFRIDFEATNLYRQGAKSNSIRRTI